MTPRPTLRILPILVAMTAVSSCGGSDGGPTTGDLVVVVSTTGTAQDPDGYSVTVTGATPISATDNDTVAVTDLSSGAHDVQLTGVASTCVGGSVVHANVPAGTSDTVAFAVTCTATTGTLAVRVATTGVALDPDGYQVAIDGGAASTVAVNGATAAASLAVGPHSVTLSGLVMNCAPALTGPYPVNVAPAASDTLTIEIGCTWPRVAVRAGSGGIALINPDGSNPVTIPLDASVEYDGQAWSVDRSKLALHVTTPSVPAPNAVAVVHPTTAPLDSMVPDPLQAIAPRWKPDGSSLLELRKDSAGSPIGLFSVDITTNSRVKISPDSLIVISADWSPDGAQVTFAARVTGDTMFTERLYVIQADGSGVTRISPDSVTGMDYVRWSPAGDRILFNRNEGAFWTISPAGSGIQKVSVAGFNLESTGTWAPDGSALMFGAVNTTTGGYALLRVSPAGAIQTTLPHTGGPAWLDPDWR